MYNINKEVGRRSVEEGKNKEITDELKGFYPKSLSSYQDQACICVYS